MKMDRTALAANLLVVLRTLRTADVKLSYRQVLEILGVIGPREPWNPGFRSTVRKLCDIAAALAKANGENSEDLLSRLVVKRTGQPGEGYYRPHPTIT